MYDNIEQKIKERKDMLVKIDESVKAIFQIKNLIVKELDLLEYARSYKPTTTGAVTFKTKTTTKSKVKAKGSKKKPSKKPWGKKLSKNGKPLGRPPVKYTGMTLGDVMNPGTDQRKVID